jgi:hypothetical protein
VAAVIEAQAYYLRGSAGSEELLVVRCAGGLIKKKRTAGTLESRERAPAKTTDESVLLGPVLDPAPGGKADYFQVGSLQSDLLLRLPSAALVFDATAPGIAATAAYSR